MRNTNGLRILEESNDYIILYRQFAYINCWNKFKVLQSISLTVKTTNEMYFEEKLFESKNIPRTGKEEEKYLRRGVKILLKRMKENKK